MVVLVSAFLFTLPLSALSTTAKASESGRIVVGAPDGTNCIYASGPELRMGPCATADTDWIYDNNRLRLRDRCVRVEALATGGYRIRLETCSDQQPEQDIVRIGHKTTSPARGLCLTAESTYIGLRSIESASFKSYWQDFDTPSNWFFVNVSDEQPFDFNQSEVFMGVPRPFVLPAMLTVHDFFVRHNNWLRQSSYAEAYDFAQGHIMIGHPDVTVFQTDSDVPSLTRFPSIIGAENIPPGNHSDNVAGILYDCGSAPDPSIQVYEGCMIEARKTTRNVYDLNDVFNNANNDWRTMDAWIGQGFPGGITPTVFTASVANTFYTDSPDASISTPDLSVRFGDYLFDRYNIIAFTSQPGSYIDQNLTVSGNFYNAVVVGNLTAGPNYGSHSGLDNTNGIGRYKPDIVTVGQNAAGSSSWATPTVAVLATGLRSVAASNVRFQDARWAEVIHAVILAGASKDDAHQFLQVYDVATSTSNPWTWRQELPSKPFDPQFGAGMLNYLNTYRIFFAGQYRGNARANGWDTKVIAAGETHRFNLGAGITNPLSIMLTWNRKVTAVGAKMLTAQLADLELTLRDANTGAVIAVSDAAGNNREHIYLRTVPSTSLELLVRSKSGNGPVRYGLAWGEFKP